MRRLLFLTVGLLLVVTACGDDSAGTTVTANNGSVIFGEGELPPGIPEDFPVPPNAIIGTTLIDNANHRSEVNFQVNTAYDVTIRFFTVGLVSEGFVVDSSTGTGTSWNILFSRGELSGTIIVTPQGERSQASVTVNQV